MAYYVQNRGLVQENKQEPVQYIAAPVGEGAVMLDCIREG